VDVSYKLRGFGNYK